MVIIIILVILGVPIAIIYLKSLFFWDIPKGMSLFIGAPRQWKDYHMRAFREAV